MPVQNSKNLLVRLAQTVDDLSLLIKRLKVMLHDLKELLFTIAVVLMFIYHTAFLFKSLIEHWK